MKKYIVLFSDRFDMSKRYWVREDSQERAENLARQYEKYGQIVEIYEVSTDLWDK